MSDPLLDKLDEILGRRIGSWGGIDIAESEITSIKADLRALLADVAIEATEAQWLTRLPREQWDPWIAADMRRQCRARFAVAPEQEERR